MAPPPEAQLRWLVIRNSDCAGHFKLTCYKGQMKCKLHDVRLARKKWSLEAHTIKANLETTLCSVNCMTHEYHELQKPLTCRSGLICKMQVSHRPCHYWMMIITKTMAWMSLTVKHSTITERWWHEYLFTVKHATIIVIITRYFFWGPCFDFQGHRSQRSNAVSGA